MNNLAKTIEGLKSSLPAKSWSEDKQQIAPYLQEWRGRWQGETPILLLPKSTQEVVKIVKICAANKTPIRIQGGNTGLVGGQIPKGEILLSTTRLNKIRAQDKTGMSMVCEAGVRLQQAQEVAREIGLFFPLSLASQGSCTLGGNLATNAGGVHVIKYGTMRRLVFGVEAVMADGRVFNGLAPLHKDNTGPDLSQILIGAEGTLGIITAARLRLYKPAARIDRAMVGLVAPDKAVALLEFIRAKTNTAGQLSMFEIMPHLALDFVKQAHGLKSPVKQKFPFYVLLDMEFSGDEGQENCLQKRLVEAMEKGIIQDAVIAKNDREAAALLALRENISAAQKPHGACIKHDIAVPISNVARFIARASDAVLRFIPTARLLAFGHVGDGNIHFNIVQPVAMRAEDFMAKEKQINKIVYDIVARLGGTISAEHGIGILKKQELKRYGSKIKLDMMRAVKQSLDPAGIFNPGVLF